MSQDEEALSLWGYLVHKARNRSTSTREVVVEQVPSTYSRRFHVRYFFNELLAKSKYVYFTPLVVAGVALVYIVYRLLHHFFFGTYLMNIVDSIVNEFVKLFTKMPQPFGLGVSILLVVWILYTVRAYFAAFYGWRKSRAVITPTTTTIYVPSNWILGLEGKNQSFESNVIHGAELTRDDIDNFPFLGTSATVTLLTNDMNGGRSGLFQVIASKPDKMLEVANEIARQNREQES
jgi:predicted PurR-regulated permease PerM